MEQLDTDVVATVDDMLAPYHRDLGRDATTYRNHVLRVLFLSDDLAAEFCRNGTLYPIPSSSPDFVLAAAFHDLGIWTAHTCDYLQPSMMLATRHAIRSADDYNIGLITAMIAQHHKLRAAAPSSSSIEYFASQTQWISAEVCMAAVAATVPQSTTTPRWSSHGALIRMAAQRSRHHPT